MSKGKKGGGSNTPMMMTMAMTGGVFLLRKLLGIVWTRVTGKTPPTDLSDPKVTLTEALAWSVATGLIIESARFAILHNNKRQSVEEAEADAS